jgi:hypothetical protein
MEEIIKAQSLFGNNLLVAGFSTKKHGQMKFGSDESRKEVLKNRNRFLADLGIVGQGTLVRAGQVHGTYIHEVKGGDLRKDNKIWQEAKIKNCDSFFTQLSKTWLAITVADCVPLLVWSNDGNLVAAIHAGWQGTLNKVASKTVKKISKGTDYKTADLNVFIGPSIGPDHFEAKDYVYSSFKRKFNNDNIFQFQDGKKYIDLWQANKNQLIEAGIDEDKIEVSGLCTVCHNKKFYSHRAGDKGRIMGLIGIKD